MWSYYVFLMLYITLFSVMLGVPVVLPATLSSIFSHAPLLLPPPSPSGAGLIAGSPEYIAEESVRVLKTAPFASLFHLTSMSLRSLTSTSSSATNSGSSSCYQESKNKHVKIHTKNFIQTHRKVTGWMKLFNYLWNREIQFKYCIIHVPLLLPLPPLPPPLQFLLYPEHFQKHC